MRRPSTTLSTLALLAAVAVAGLAQSGCTVVQQVLALRQVDFRVDRVSGGVLAGVDLRGTRSVSRLAPGELFRLAQAVDRGELPLEFTLHLAARNPADNPVAARLLRLDWTLYLDGRRTIDGLTEHERLIRPGETADVPLRMELDLLRFFRDDARGLADLALDVLGYGGRETPDLELRARPTVMTDLGPIEYPGEIVIASRADS